ncbi:MAG: monovalent cation:proton antiporter-2 (CPA2) family protein [Reyranellaceae bacterium]
MSEEAGSASHYAMPEAMLLLGVAIVVAPVFHRLRLSPVLGYLLGGILLGPMVLRLVADNEGNRFLAELGVVFLLFIIGLELSLERLRLMRRLVFGLGMLQVGLCGLALAGAAWALGLGIYAALVVGFALALSSTAMVLQLLTERGELNSRAGRASFGVLLLQDLAVVPLLVFVTVLASRDPDVGEAMGMALLRAIGVVAAIGLVGWLVLPRLFALIARTHRPEAFTALALVAVLGAAWVTEQAGVSMALGAFLAGVALAGSRFRHQIEADIRPFEGLLLGLFFVTVGMRIQFAPILEAPLVFVGLLAGMLAIKGVLIFGLALAFGLRGNQALRTALLLAQGGEFAFVLIVIAGGSGVVPREVAPLVFALAAVSMALTPLMEVIGRGVSRRIARRDEDRQAQTIAAEAGALSQHVLICGFGRVGQTVAMMLDYQRVPWLAIDGNADLVEQFEQDGATVRYGDASRRDVLVAAGVGRARAAVITLDSSKGAVAAVEAIRHEAPNLPIFARARDHAHAVGLTQAGNLQAVPETLEASLQLSARLLRALDVDGATVERLVELHRAGDYAALAKLGASEAQLRAALSGQEAEAAPRSRRGRR